MTAKSVLPILTVGALLCAAPATAKTVLTLNITQTFETIDPAKITDYTDYLGAVNLYDGLTHVDPDGKIIPRLAQSWDVAKDGLSVTFHLKPDAKFQDGSPVTAKDVVYSVKRLMTINQGPSALLGGVLDPDGAKAIDDHTVLVSLKKIFSPFIALTPLILVVNEKLVEAHTVNNDWGQAWMTDHIASGGPYTIQSWDHGGGMVMARNPAYEGGWPQHPIDEIHLPLTNDEATVLAMAASGQLTMASQFQTNETYEAMAKMGRFKLQNDATPNAFYLKMNSKMAPTDDVHVRRAVACAVDYQTIREQILTGEPMAGPLPSSFKQFHLSTLKPAAQDLECAKSELAKSKYASAGPVKITLTYVGGLKFEEDVGLLMQSTLNGLGFEVTLDPEPWNRITQIATKVETTPALSEVFFEATYPSPDSMFYTQYDTKAAGTWASMEWLGDPAVDKMIDDARSTYDTAAQADIYGKLQAHLVDGQSDAYLMVKTTRSAMDKCLQGFHAVPMQSWAWDFSKMSWSCP
jgi:peptide/nickel transport system substrate-binding protein